MKNQEIVQKAQEQVKQEKEQQAIQYTANLLKKQARYNNQIKDLQKQVADIQARIEAVDVENFEGNDENRY